MPGRTRNTTDVPEALSTMDAEVIGEENVAGSAVVPSTQYDEDALRSITTFDEAMALTRETHGDISDASEEIGDGFALLSNEDKAKLIGVPLLLMEWRENMGDFGPFMSIRLVARNRDGSMAKYILNDGSTGIAEGLRQFTQRTGKTGGLALRNGLRVSEYTFCDVCQSAACSVPDLHAKNNHRKARTFYLDTSA